MRTSQKDLRAIVEEALDPDGGNILSIDKVYEILLTCGGPRVWLTVDEMETHYHYYEMGMGEPTYTKIHLDDSTQEQLWEMCGGGR